MRKFSFYELEVITFLPFQHVLQKQSAGQKFGARQEANAIPKNHNFRKFLNSISSNRQHIERELPWNRQRRLQFLSVGGNAELGGS